MQLENWKTEHLILIDSIYENPELFEYGRSSHGDKGHKTWGNMSAPQIKALLNLACKNLEEDEIYCEIGIYKGNTLTGALLDNHAHAVGVDNFSQFGGSNGSGDVYKQLITNLENMGVIDRVEIVIKDFKIFFEEYNGKKFGVYFYDGRHSYEDQTTGLELAIPNLANNALIFIDDCRDSEVKRATKDFCEKHEEATMIFEKIPNRINDPFWHMGLQIVEWKSL